MVSKHIEPPADFMSSTTAQVQTSAARGSCRISKASCTSSLVSPSSLLAAPIPTWRFWGHPNSWMVYNGKSYFFNFSMDDLGVPPNLGNLHTHVMSVLCILQLSLKHTKTSKFGHGQLSYSYVFIYELDVQIIEI